MSSKGTTRKILNGRESSILCLLAQCKGLTSKDKKRILSALEGHALKIAKVILGEKTKSSRIREAAAGILDWAAKLGQYRR